MPGTSGFGIRLVIATGILLALLALLFTLPAIMAGDIGAFGDLLKIGGGMSFALLIGVLIVVLPLGILLGVIRIDISGTRLPMALAGGIAAFVFSLFGLGAVSGDLSTAGVLLLTLGGAIAGWLTASRGGKAE